MKDNKKVKEVKARVVKEEFSGKNLTLFGGAGLIRRFFDKLKLMDTLSSLDSVHPKQQGYQSSQMVTSLLYGLFFGLSRPYNMLALCWDGVFQTVSRLFSFPVQSTISRFLAGVSKAVGDKVAEINLDMLLKMRDGFKEFLLGITIDLDSHVTTVFGNQQRAKVGYNPKKNGRKSYHPLMAFIGETRDFIKGSIRPGNRHTSYDARGFVASIIRALPVKVRRLRADCGFFSTDFIWWLRKKGIEYYIAVPLHPWVQKMILSQERWVPIKRGITGKELELSLGKTVSCRLVVIRTEIGKKEKPKKQLSLIKGYDALYDYQVIATNSRRSPYEIWKFYNKRANCENMIKEGIYSFGMDNMVSHEYAGNVFWFQTVMLGYNLMNWFKEKVLGQEEKKSFGESIRQRLFLIPGRLIQSGRRVILRLAENWYWRGDFEAALDRLSS